MEKILLTGATGFLGSHLIPKLLEYNYSILAYKRPSSSLEKCAAFSDKITWYDSQNLEQPFREHAKIHHILHLATCYGRNEETISHIIETNFLFPMRLLELGIRYQVDNFINADTFWPEALSDYSASKAQFLAWLKILADTNRINPVRLINLKIEHMYGPGDSGKKFIPYVVSACLRNQTIKLTDGEQSRDFIYIDDVVSAFIVILKTVFTFEAGLTVFAVGSAESVLIKDIVKKIHMMTNSHSELLFGAIKKREHEPDSSVADITELTALGWFPQYSLHLGLQKMIEIERGNHDV